MSQPLQPELSLTAVCGLFCPGCFIYIASHDPDEEKRIAGASRYGMPLEKIPVQRLPARRRASTTALTAKMSPLRRRERASISAGRAKNIPAPS